MPPAANCLRRLSDIIRSTVQAGDAVVTEIARMNAGQRSAKSASAYLKHLIGQAHLPCAPLVSDAIQMLREFETLQPCPPFEWEVRQVVLLLQGHPRTPSTTLRMTLLQEARHPAHPSGRQHTLHSLPQQAETSAAQRGTHRYVPHPMSQQIALTEQEVQRSECGGLHVAQGLA